MKKRTWKDRLRPFADHIQEMATLIRVMEDAELKALAAAITRPTTTNCGWSTYQAAGVIEREVASELYRRKQQKSAGATATVDGDA